MYNLILSQKMELEFFKFIYQRQLIWYKRFVLKMKYPWTDDRILNRYKIINMYRELDKCTIYLLDKLKEIKDRRSILLNVVFYRFFNKFNLYEDLGIKPFEKVDSALNGQLIASFNKIIDKGLPIFNNAYIISSGKPHQKKYVTILNNLETLSIKIDKFILIIDASKTPKESFEILKEIPMVGSFLACEFWTDLSYLNFFRQGWTDNDFVNIGPGARWGLEIIYNMKLDKNEQINKLYHLHKIQEKVFPFIDKKLDIDLPWGIIAYKNAFSNYPYLSLTNIEGDLCEFRKYWNLKQGRGKKRYFKQGNYLNNVKF